MTPPCLTFHCTLSRYASNAKRIKNKPQINEDPKDALLREYQEEIMRLKMTLENRKNKGGDGKPRRRQQSIEGVWGKRRGSVDGSVLISKVVS